MAFGTPGRLRAELIIVHKEIRMPLSPFEFIAALLYSVAIIGLIISAVKRSWKAVFVFIVLLVIAGAANAWLATG